MSSHYNFRIFLKDLMPCGGAGVLSKNVPQGEATARQDWQEINNLELSLRYNL
jgi:hypothetical protein